MSAKRELAKEINLLDAEIRELESRRSRSQASIIEALVSKTTPNENELQFFRTFTAEIEVKRERLVQLQKQLQNLL